jgi:hypothetical protein
MARQGSASPGDFRVPLVGSFGAVLLGIGQPPLELRLNLFGLLQGDGLLLAGERLLAFAAASGRRIAMTRDPPKPDLFQWPRHWR